MTAPPAPRTVTLHEADAVWLKVLLDAAVPREPVGPMGWEGVGRRYAESLLGFRERCRCTDEQLIQDSGVPHEPGCAVHDLSVP